MPSPVDFRIENQHAIFDPGLIYIYHVFARAHPGCHGRSLHDSQSCMHASAL